MAMDQNKSSGSTAMIVIAVALVAFGMGWFVGSKNVDPAGPSPRAESSATGAAARGGQATGQDSTRIPIADSPIRGNVNAPITIVDFSSLQCPFCARGNETLKQLLDKYPNDVRIVSKNFPLAFQAQSPAAAKAAMAAGEQGKYWEMKDMLFQNMQRFREAPDMKELTAGFAQQLGLDVDKFKADFDKPEYDTIIKRDQDLGASLGVRGTPHYFINGERVSGAQPLDRFEEIVKRQLGEAKEMLAAGVSRDALYKEMVDKNYAAEPSQPTPAPAAAEAVEVFEIPVDNNDHIKGAKDDYLVTVVEFSSFQCPFCARGAETLRALHKKYPQVRFVSKHFPLAFQAQSEPAARAAIAAERQGKYWEMYDLIYENQRNLTQPGIFEDLAKRVGLNVDKFKRDMEDPAVAERVKTTQAQGSAAGVRGTPAFFVNGIKLVGAKPQADFEREIDNQIKIAEQLKKEKNLKGDALYKALVAHNKANAPKAPAAAPAAAPEPAAKVAPGDLQVGKSHTKGPANAPVTIYEFSSFQCPFCARGAETLRQIVKEYPTQVRVVYKNFPLAFQAQAEPAARAALAAGKQGKFWEMYDAIYENQRRLAEPGIFDELANKVGVNVAKFKTDMESSEIAEQVKAEQAEGTKIGVRGTPAFFINGNRLVGAQPIDEFKKIIDAEIAAAKK